MQWSIYTIIQKALTHMRHKLLRGIYLQLLKKEINGKQKEHA
jgi:hypothetical protein